MNTETLEIVEDLINQAKTGRVAIGTASPDGAWSFFTRFFATVEGKTNATNSTYPVLKIANMKNFCKMLDEYFEVALKFYDFEKDYFDVTPKQHKQLLLHSLFVNATPYDFENPMQYIQTKTAQLKTPLKEGVFEIGTFGEYKIKTKIEKLKSNFEAPYRQTFVFETLDGSDSFQLPFVNCGFVDNFAYVYSVQNTSKKQETSLAKKLDRFFRKLNKDVDPTDEMAQVSPNAVATSALFFSLLKQNGITNIVAPSFSPVRYNGTKISAYAKLNQGKNPTPLVTSHKQALEWENRNQYSMTNKFMYLFLRYAHHFPETDLHFNDTTQTMFATLAPTQEVGDNIIYDLDMAVTSPVQIIAQPTAEKTK